MADDVTAGRSADTPRNAELDPTASHEAENPTAKDWSEPDQPADEPRDVTAGRSAGTAWNVAQDPTRPTRPPRRS